MSPPTRREFLQGAAAVGASWVLLGRGADAVPSLEPDLGEWLAGDLHCHTIHSGDVRGPADLVDTDVPDPEGFQQRLGLTAAQQIALAEARRLDFLAITDHNNLRALQDPGYRSALLVLVPGYEHSLGEHGHVGVLGVNKRIRVDREHPKAAVRLKRKVEQRRGLFIPTHPYSPKRPWAPATRVRPHALEVWNGAHSLPRALRSVEGWERDWLARRRVPAVGGSDSHFARRIHENGVGQPTTWVRARKRTWRSILNAIKAGRTSVSMAPPALGGARLLLEADDGSDLRTIGGRAAAGVRLGVTAVVDWPWLPDVGAGHVRLIVDGRRIKSRPVGSANQRITWAVTPRRYVRAELIGEDPQDLLAFTSPIWVRKRS